MAASTRRSQATQATLMNDVAEPSRSQTTCKSAGPVHLHTPPVRQNLPCLASLAIYRQTNP